MSRVMTLRNATWCARQLLDRLHLGVGYYWNAVTGASSPAPPARPTWTSTAHAATRAVIRSQVEARINATDATALSKANALNQWDVNADLNTFAVMQPTKNLWRQIHDDTRAWLEDEQVSMTSLNVNNGHVFQAFVLPVKAKSLGWLKRPASVVYRLTRFSPFTRVSSDTNDGYSRNAP